MISKIIGLIMLGVGIAQLVRVFIIKRKFKKNDSEKVAPWMTAFGMTGDVIIGCVVIFLGFICATVGAGQ
ncbi:hypothetical protein [Lactococcus hircilactis]|uniref:hypothetical protein n=1 Tax=Lactococcus hircilactis TaxID=1494462 RepID=UPI003FA2998C